jgi:hypothetical protein
MNNIRPHQYPTKVNHSKTSKHTIKPISNSIKHILTHKIKKYAKYRCSIKLGKFRRFYYHDNRYKNPWDPVKKISPELWCCVRNAFMRCNNRDPDCKKFIEINDAYPPPPPLQTLPVELPEAPNPKKLLYKPKNKQKNKSTLMLNQTVAESLYNSLAY